MLSFYGELTCKLPCVICDAGLRVLFANKTAYGDPITVKWIDEGKPSFGKALIATMENAFEAEPFGIARLDACGPQGFMRCNRVRICRSR